MRTQLHTTLFIVASFVTFNIQAQEEKSLKPTEGVEITHGNAYAIVREQNKNYFKTEKGYISVKINAYENVIFIQVLDNNCNLIAENTLRYNNDTKCIVKKIKERLFILQNIRQDEQVISQAREINITTGQLNTEIFILNGSEVVRQDNETNIAPSFHYLSSEFVKNIHSVNSNFLIQQTGNFTRQKSNITPILEVSVYNEDLLKVWHNKIENQYIPRWSTVSILYAHDNIYLIGKKFNPKVSNANRSNPEYFNWMILTVTEEGEITENEVNFGEGKVVLNVKLDETSDGKVILSGVYSQHKISHGVFYLEITDDGNFIEPIFLEFESDFKNIYASKLLGGGRDAKRELSFDYLEIRKFEVQNDGGSLISCELYNYNLQEGTKMLYDIVLVKTNKNKELSWVKKIPKRSSQESFKLYTTDNYVFVIFRDNPNNIHLQENATPYFKAIGVTNLMAYRFDLKDGERENIVLLDLMQIDGTSIRDYDLYKLLKTSFAIEFYIGNNQDMMYHVDFSTFDN